MSVLVVLRSSPNNINGDRIQWHNYTTLSYDAMNENEMTISNKIIKKNSVVLIAHRFNKSQIHFQLNMALSQTAEDIRPQLW